MSGRHGDGEKWLIPMAALRAYKSERDKPAKEARRPLPQAAGAVGH